MFSQQKPVSMFSMGGTSMPGQQQKKTKPLTPEEKQQQALVTANVFFDESRARVAKATEAYSAVANNGYWLYGYMGGNMMAVMAACLTLGNRWAFFRSYSSWISLAGGYIGGKMCLATHSSFLMANVVKQFDHEIQEAERMDEQTAHIIPDYLREAERLRRIKYELAPDLPEAVAAHSQSTAVTLDDRVDELVEAYMMRKETLEKK